jgi:hypothetical protein
MIVIYYSKMELYLSIGRMNKLMMTYDNIDDFISENSNLL